jgi:hypothetical protein
MGKRIIILAIMLLAASVAIASFAPTESAFSDTETATLSVSSGAWHTQADDLLVNTDCAGIWSPRCNCACPCITDLCERWEGSILYGIFLRNIGENDITIDKIKIHWIPPQDSEHVQLVQIIFNDWIEWMGSEPSGTLIDINNCTLRPSDLLPKSLFILFDSDMQEKDFIIVFIMSDGSTKSVGITPG